MAEMLRMKAAAERLAFEQAARIKQRIERANLVGAESYEQMGRLEDFRVFVAATGEGADECGAVVDSWRAGGMFAAV